MKRFFFLAILVMVNFIVLSQENTIHGNGASLHYKIIGSGEPVLLINGGPGMSSKGIEGLANKLSKNNSIIIYDQRGTGWSEVSSIDEETISLKLMIKDIEVLREHLGIESWVVFGHSFGGMLAYFYAAKYPKRVKAMVQSSSAGMGWLDRLLYFYPGENLTIEERDTLKYYSNALKNGDSTAFNLKRHAEAQAEAYLFKDDPEILAQKVEEMLKGNTSIRRLVSLDVNSNGLTVTNKMKRFKKPVLLIQGDNDLFLEDQIIEHHRILRNSRMVILPDCGHWGMIEQPEIYFGEIYEFLKKIEENDPFKFSEE